MQVPLLGKRRERKTAELRALINAGIEKAMPAIAAGAQDAADMVSGATYGMNPSSPFDQTGANYGFNPLPRPYSTFGSGFGPATPLSPDAIDPLRADGRTDFRRDQYRVAYNLTFNDRDVPWTVLRQVATQVDVVARCIELVQDAIIGMEWSWSYSRSIINQIKVETGEKNSGKAVALARDKYGEELARVQKFFERPDKRDDMTFSQWLTEAVWSSLTYDGIAIAPMYTLGGELHSLSQIDTSTIKILRDNGGFLPAPPAPAYQQWLYGFPRSEAQAQDYMNDGEALPGFTQDQMAYYIRRPRPHTRYGFSTVEETINIATLYQERQAWMHAEWSHGVTPKGIIKTGESENWTPEQLGYYQQILNDQWSGQTQRRQQVMILRPGMEWEQLKDFAELYNTDFEEWCVMQIGSKFGVPQTQLGIPMKSMRSMSGTQNQTSMDLTDKFALDALVNFLVDCINDLAQRFLGVGSEITMSATAGNGDQSDFQRAQADASDVNAGIRTRNEIRVERGLPLITEEEADELGVTTATGVTFITGQLAAQEAQQELLENGNALTTPRARSSKLDQRADPDVRPTAIKPVNDVRQPDLATPAPSGQQSGHAESGSYSEKAKLNAGPLAKREDYPSGGETATPVASGICVRAADSGRILLLQRALDDTDPAQGTWEFPGGCIESGETSAAAAVREFQEETGANLPDGEMIADWICPVGTYQTFLWEIPHESDMSINLDADGRFHQNPDDSDGDRVETLAWFDIADLPGNPSLRDEMQMNPWHTIATKPIVTEPQSQNGATKGIPVSVAKEANQFLQYASRRVRLGKGWRDFEFTSPLSDSAEELNDLGREGDMITLKAIVNDLQEHSLGKVRASRKAGRRKTVALSERLHDEITDHYSILISEAMNDVVGIETAIEQARKVWPKATKASGDENPIPSATPMNAPGFSESSDLGPVGNEIATDALMAHLRFASDDVRRVLTDLYQDAGVIGSGVAAQSLGIAVTTDLKNWSPGNLAAAQTAATPGLQAILANLGITLRGLTDSAIERMSNVLANGLNEGLPSREIAQAMAAIISDPQRAAVIARTEAARAMGAASLATMAKNGTAQWVWHDNAGACAACVDNADNGPYPIGEGPTFPEHPNCRCTPLPYVEDFE